MKNRAIVLILFILVSAVSFGVAQAAGQTYEKKEIVQQNPDAEADQALGILPEKGKKVKSAAKEEAEKFEAKSETDKAVEEVNKRLAEDEKKRLQRNITEDKLLGR